MTDLYRDPDAAQHGSTWRERRTDREARQRVATREMAARDRLRSPEETRRLLTLQGEAVRREADAKRKAQAKAAAEAAVVWAKGAKQRARLERQEEAARREAALVRRRELAAARREAALAQQAAERAARLRPAPALIRSARDAEAVVATWMPYLGLGAGVVTGNGADGGIDVASDSHVVQVKFEALATSRPAVQALYGVATAEGKAAAFFASAGYRAPAREWADRVGLLLYTFDLQGEPQPANAASRTALTLAQQAS